MIGSKTMDEITREDIDGELELARKKLAGYHKWRDQADEHITSMLININHLKRLQYLKGY